MRDVRKDPQYWSGAEDRRMLTIDISDAIMRKGPRSEGHRMRLRLSKVNAEFELLVVAFSRGDPLEECRERYLSCLRSSADLWDMKTNYTDLLWYVSLGVLFRVDRQDAAILEQIAVASEMADKLICALLRTLNPQHTVQPVDEIPSPYHNAYEVLSMDQPRAEKALEKYLERQWYRGQRDQEWYDTHKRDDFFYMGYWSFETAALVRILGLNDEKLKNSPYYPPEIAHFE